jgi:D-alanyl-D-alanine carboxypeptidase (penicillin-binding protein 5/6)
VEGIKTGWTPLAGDCFAGLVNINGHKVITVLLGSNDRFGETKKIIDWIKQAITWKNI